jgi:hypothetical protein
LVYRGTNAPKMDGVNFILGVERGLYLPACRRQTLIWSFRYSRID